MFDRVEIEKREHLILDSKACKSDTSKGREFKEEPCQFRTEFQRDRDRIIHSKAFRRLMHKTQVFLAPEGDHYRTRLTHTLEVSQISRTIARNLRLNEDLTEAIALGHDLGHTPFGHNGEMILNSIHPTGFKHNEQSLRVVEKLENTGKRQGMNLTEEVKNGILNHNGNIDPFTLEGQIVKLCDRVAYINHDIDDAIRSGVIKIEELPKDAIDIFGSSHQVRVNNMVRDIIKYSENRDNIQLSPLYKEELNKLRAFMFANVYKSHSVKKEEDLTKVETVVTSLYNYYIKYPQEMPEESVNMLKHDQRDEVVKDYIAGMTDRYALNLYTELFVPKGWK